MNVLFVCNQNKHRSKTAEFVFKKDFNVKSAGLFSGKILDSSLLKWADTVFVMEEFQREEIAKKFPKEYFSKRIICLDIDDSYSYGQSKLIELLKEKVGKEINLLTTH